MIYVQVDKKDCFPTRRRPCREDERDALLYHILSQQPGLVIVFVNAISALRRLLSILKILKLPVEGLHGSMQQRARLKYLDRFRSSVGGGGCGGGKNTTSVLVATDVAARGLDVKGIDLVVHYQVPLSADTYVHRSGGNKVPSCPTPPFPLTPPHSSNPPPGAAFIHSTLFLSRRRLSPPMSV